MDLESTQGHHRLLTKYTGEGREGGLPYLGVEERRKAAARRNPSSAGLDAWTPTKRRRFWRFCRWPPGFSRIACNCVLEEVRPAAVDDMMAHR